MLVHVVDNDRPDAVDEKALDERRRLLDAQAARAGTAKVTAELVVGPPDQTLISSPRPRART